MRPRRAAITGMGPVCALGIDIGSFWRALIEGRSGIRTITRFELPGHMGSAVAEVSQVDPPKMVGREPMSRGLQLSRIAARRAFESAALRVDPERIGLIVGTSFGNLDLIEAILSSTDRHQYVPMTGFRVFTHNAACEIARELNIRGPTQTVSSGCNSGADAMGLALDWLQLGRVDAVLVGGVEAALTPSYFKAMTAARALSRKFNGDPQSASRPFAADRDGNVPGEGAAFVVMEPPDLARARGAKIAATMRGFASRAVGDRPAYDPRKPVYDPDAMIRVIRAALADAQLEPSQLSLISANGSSSVFYDRLEAAAIAAVLRDHLTQIPVSSIKGALGQTGAVTPVLQAISAALSIRDGTIPPTLNAERPDPELPAMTIHARATQAPVEHILANSIGFGGFYYASTVFGPAAD